MKTSIMLFIVAFGVLYAGCWCCRDIFSDPQWYHIPTIFLTTALFLLSLLGFGLYGSEASNKKRKETEEGGRERR